MNSSVFICAVLLTYFPCVPFLHRNLRHRILRNFVHPDDYSTTRNSTSPVRVAVMGSTGSIGTQTLDIISKMNTGGDRFKVVALTANENFRLLSRQIERFKPEVAHICKHADLLKDMVGEKTELVTGNKALLDLCSSNIYDLLVIGISGSVGIEPTVAAARSGKRIALANKESVVSAGELLKNIVREHGSLILPVDSEHNAIYQCISPTTTTTSDNHSESICNVPQNTINSVKRLILTSSGGPFREVDASVFGKMRISDNISHPVWSMGAKITVDSSSMMNKGLEVIEAHYLFGLPLEKIEILIHKECIVHSMVEFVDNSVISQMYLPDMRLPIAYSLNWPERIPNGLQPIDLTAHTLSFTSPDFDKFPALKLAYQVGKMGGLYPAVLNAANDRANELFRMNTVTFYEMFSLVKTTVENFNPDRYSISLQDILEADKWAKNNVDNLQKKM